MRIKKRARLVAYGNFQENPEGREFNPSVPSDWDWKLAMSLLHLKLKKRRFWCEKEVIDELIVNEEILLAGGSQVLGQPLAAAAADSQEKARSMRSSEFTG